MRNSWLEAVSSIPKILGVLAVQYALVWNTSSGLSGSKSWCGSQPQLCVPLLLYHLWCVFSSACPFFKPAGPFTEARGGVTAWLQLEHGRFPSHAACPAPSHSCQAGLQATQTPVLIRKHANTWEGTHNNILHLEALSCKIRSTLNSQWCQMGAGSTEHLSDKIEVVVQWLEKIGIHWI